MHLFHPTLLLPVSLSVNRPSRFHESILYVNVFPLTIHSSIRRERLKSMVKVQSRVNWQMLPAQLGWREWVMRGTGWGGKELTTERRPFSNGKGETASVYLRLIFYSSICASSVSLLFPGIAHSSVCLSTFPPSTTSTHSFFIYQILSSTNSLWSLNINVAKNCQGCGIIFLKLYVFFPALFWGNGAWF